MSQYFGDKPSTLDRIHYMTLDQQAQIIKLIEEIEAAETLPIPRIIMMMDVTYLWIRSKGNNQYRSTVLGSSPVKVLVEYMREQHKLLIGEPTAQKVAEEIGSVLPLAQERTYTIKGRSLESGLPASIDVSSIEERKALLARSFDDKFFEGLQFFINQTLIFY